MSSHRLSSLNFLSGAGLSMGDAQGFDGMWLNPSALNPRAGLWNANPPSSSSNPNPPSSSSNPNPPSSSSNPNPPSGPNAIDPVKTYGAWPLPSMAPPPRLGPDPAWVYADPAALLGQALRKSRAKIVRTSDLTIQPGQMKKAFNNGIKVQGSNLWRWAPEFRIKTVAAELMGRLQVQGTTLWLLEPVDPAGKLAQPLPIFALPPSMDAAKVNMEEQIDKVMRAAAEREDRLPEILSQMLDFWPFFESITGLPLSQAPRTAELLAATHDCMLHLLMQLKHGFAALRPVQRFSLVMPLIPTPGHGSLPSGHATMAAYTSELLHLMLYRDPDRAWDVDRTEQLDRLARRIAFNRVVAGVHFPIDSMAGYALGRQMARLTSALAGNAEDLPAPIKSSEVLRAPFELAELFKEVVPVPAAQGAADKGAPPPQPSEAPELRTLWQQAMAELNDLRV